LPIAASSWIADLSTITRLPIAAHAPVVGPFENGADNQMATVKDKVYEKEQPFFKDCSKKTLLLLSVPEMLFFQPEVHFHRPERMNKRPKLALQLWTRLCTLPFFPAKGFKDPYPRVQLPPGTTKHRFSIAIMQPADL
jgi:hypothetical protein